MSDALSMSDAFPGSVTSTDELRQHYRNPSSRVQAKKVCTLDEPTRAFIGSSPFVLVATADAQGRCDVSPRGGSPGFVRVLDEQRLLIPDLNGNNLLDSLQNIVVNPHIGLLFVLPGRDETLRVEGRAVVTVDDALLASFTDIRRPLSAIGVVVDKAFIHCAKSFRRGRVWDATSWEGLVAPSALELLACHLQLYAPIDPALMEQGYAADLAADAPA
jgi:PPOX class probable FMN-dependent enzyme